MLRSSRLPRLAIAFGVIAPLTLFAWNRHALLLPPGAVAVTPDGTSTPTRTPNTNGYAATFNVKNNATSTVTYTLTRESSSNVTTTGQQYASVTLAQNANINVDVYYNVGSAGSGYVKLWAEGSAGIDAGTFTVPVGPTAKVTPDGGTAPNRLTNTNGHSQNFTVKNEGTSQTTFTLTCSGSSNVTCIGVTPSSVTLAGGAQNPDVIANYNVGSTGTGTLKVTATGGVGSDTGWYSVPVISYGVAVTPDSGESLLHQPNRDDGGTAFTVQNIGTQTDTFTFSCAASGNITCDKDGFGYPSITPPSAILAGGAQTNVAVAFKTAESGIGRVYLGASGHHSSDQGWKVVPVENTTFGVTPAISSTKGAFTSTSYQAFFVLNNPDTAGHSYTLGCNTSANITCSTIPAGTLVFVGGTSQNIQANYTVGAGASGNGYIWLTVNAVDLYNGPGKLNFTIWPNVAHSVAVTPASGTGPNRSSFTNGYTSSFTVRNVGTSSDTYTFSCQPAANVTCSNVSPASQLLGPLDTAVVTATYNAGASGSSYVRLQASNANANNTGQINFTIAPSMGYAVAVTPDAKPIGALANTATSYPFTVRNPGTVQNTYTITATCSGAAIASGCTPSPTSVTVPSGGTSVVTVSYTSGGASTTGTIKLTAKQTTDTVVKDTAWVNLAIGTAQAPVASVATVNPGVSLERDLCITVALAGAAAECGDLRLAHGLPAVRTMGRARAPTLIYSSAQAHPYPLVATEVTLPASAANPDSVEAVLRFNGIEKKRARWAGHAFSPGRANRITIGLDSLNLPTGLYSYTLEINSLYPALHSATPIPSGQLIVVNRAQSEFGAGWWLGGLERLYLDSMPSMLWVGGDGSARVYRPAGTNVWAAAAVDRPDTLKKIGNEYVRLLPAKAEVWFDVTGRHLRTISRLRHDTTLFQRYETNGNVDSIRITVAPASQSMRYKFVFNQTSRLLDSVVAPPVGTVPRTVKVTRSGALITALQDPDTSSVSFGYGSFVNRIISRTDRVGVTASYFFDAAGKVVRDSIDPGFSQAVIVTRLRPHESVGFIGSTAPDTAVATAAIDGPRTDVGDSTEFWADRFGSPRRIRNALGYETNVRREDLNFPALVTRTQGPIGQVMRAYYSVRGHIDSVTDSATIVNGQPARTRYAWNVTWDAVTKIVPPEGDSTVIGINDTTGHRIWQQDASGSISRDSFTYYPNGLLATIREAAATEVTTFLYDVLGNPSETISPLGFHSFAYTDNIGRDTLTVSPPLDQAQPTKLLRARTVYDVVGRITKTVSWAPEMPYSVSGGISADPTPVPADTVTVETLYDLEGRPIEVSGPTVESRTYDRAGRLLTNRVGSGPTGFVYDPAGNVISQSYRNGGSVTAQFDPLNRVVLRVVPRASYPRTACVGHVPGEVVGDAQQCLYHSPWFPNIPGDSLEIPADTLVFGYDSAGNMVRADNRYAQVRRTYYLNGLLATDTLRVRNYVGSTFGHTYQLRYGYDRNGRRSWMTVGGVSAPADSFTYAYSVANGALAQVTDLAGRRYALTYRPNGALDSLKVFPAGSNTPGIKESHQYDADGRMIRRERRTQTVGLQLDSVWYTPQGKATKVSASSAAAAQGWLTITNAYNGLGAVVASQTQSNSSVYWNLEEFRADRIGNVWYQRARKAAAADSESTTSFYTGDGLLYARKAAFPQGCSPGTVHLDTLYQIADAAGNVIRAGERRQSGCDNNANNHQSASNSYYSSSNKLAAVQKWTNQSHTWEEYWYDALGRRVFTRTRHDLPMCGFPIVCPGFVDRTVWDGDQIIAEQRSSGLDSVTGGAPNFGTVRYVHLLGIDAPVAILDNRFSDARVIHYNWRGLAEGSSWSNGNPADEELGAGIKVAWPAGQGVYLKRGNNPNVGQDVTWIGSLPANGQGDAGLVYRRNRYYDPASGRFTQEDPIGLAGGLNQYGFAYGDPVNFADPFGLAGCDPPDDPKCKEGADSTATESSDSTKANDSRTAIQKVGDFAAGFGDFVTFGGTKKVRELWDCADCVDYDSGVYTAGEVAGGVTMVAGGALGAARAVGVTSRVAIHGAHHAFPLVGRLAHVQVNIWRIGVAGSGMALRIPLPWR